MPIVVDEVPPPTKVFVRSSSAIPGKSGTMTFDKLEGGTTLGALKQLITERHLLTPDKALHLSHWGIDLDGDFCTLQDFKLKTGCTLDMRTVIAPWRAAAALERVRVKCTAIEIRVLAVDSKTTGEDLKDKIYAALYNAEHEWYNANGERRAVTGATVLASTNVAADEKAGTAAAEHGEEFITAEPLGREEFGKGKVASVVRASRGGPPVQINDIDLVVLYLPPEKQRLSYRGVDIKDSDVLSELGVQHDETICLEFISPCIPHNLSIVRAENPGRARKVK